MENLFMQMISDGFLSSDNRIRGQPRNHGANNRCPNAEERRFGIQYGRVRKQRGDYKTTLLIERDKTKTIDHVLKFNTPAIVSLTELCVFFYSLFLTNLEAFSRRGLEVIVPLTSHSPKLRKVMFLD